MEAGGATHPPDEVLVERYVRYIDELSEVIEERGWPSLDTVMAAALDGVPPHETQAVIDRERLRYRAEVAAPAEAILRDRKAWRPAAVAKVPVAFTGGGGDDPAFYAQALDGVEPRFLRVAEPPETTRLALRVSWPREYGLDFPHSAFVSGADRDVLVLYVGKYRPCLGMPGFYLVLDASANSAAVVPPLPRQPFSVFSGHVTIGTGVAVLRHGGGGGGMPCEYLLAELILRRAHGGRFSCKGTLLRWWSSSSSGTPAAGRWIPTEVTLPLPCDDNEQRGHHSFCADVAFAVGGASLCWADLLQGIVMCDGVLAGGGDDPQFRFIPLPPGTPVAPGIESRFPSAARRSMCCVERDGDQVLKFVTMDGCYGRDLTITVWTLRLVVGKVPTAAAAEWEWERSFSCSYGELTPADPAQQLELLVPTYYPVLSLVDDHVIYFTAAVKLASKPERLEDCVGCVLRVDMRQIKVLSSSMLPPGSGLIPTKLVVSTFSSYLHKRSLWNEPQKSEEETRIKSEKHVVGLTSLSGDHGCTSQ